MSVSPGYEGRVTLSGVVNYLAGALVKALVGKAGMAERATVPLTVSGGG